MFIESRSFVASLCIYTILPVSRPGIKVECARVGLCVSSIERHARIGSFVTHTHIYISIKCKPKAFERKLHFCSSKKKPQNKTKNQKHTRLEMRAHEAWRYPPQHNPKLLWRTTAWITKEPKYLVVLALGTLILPLWWISRPPNSCLSRRVGSSRRSFSFFVTRMSCNVSKLSCVLPTTARAFVIILSMAPLSCLLIFPP